ncbi:MAG: CBS domain-containing protein [Streptococcaceae bacterium]|jgi:predicted transcriptional regulator|nr:CBS domain-containing protein [Streptococcaceae bacterium]
MFARSLEKMLLEKKEMLMISAENVASLMITNPLNHALLVLSQVHFSRIPVLGNQDRFVGTIGLAEVADKIIETQDKGIASLQDFTVEDVVDVTHPTVPFDWSLDVAMRLLKDYNFVPVVAEKKCFAGIITRKGLISAVNHTFHEFDKKYVTIPRLGNVVVGNSGDEK